MDKKRPVRIAAGSLASLANKRKNHPRLKSQMQTQLSLNSTSAVEQVQRHSLNSIAQPALDQVQRTSLRSTPSTTQADLEPVHQTSPDFTTQETNEQSDEQGPATEKKSRGSTQMPHVHGRSERKLIVLNEFHQPVGPDDAVVSELGSFLGTLARNSTFYPLNIFNWKEVTKRMRDDMWNYTKQKYDIPEAAKLWALKAIQDARRRFRTSLKRKYYVPDANIELQMEKRPSFVSLFEFKDLLEYWNSEEVQEMSKKNKENRKKLKYPHTVGKSSFAIIREGKKKESSVPPTNKDIFVVTRKRKPDRVYKDSYEETSSKIAEMERVEIQENEDGSQSSVDAFVSVMGPEHPGRIRLYGRGVTKKNLKEKVINSGSSLNTDEMMQQKMMEIEERMQQKMQEKFDAQKDTMRQDITMSVIAQLQLLNPEIQLDTNMLRFNVRSSSEATNQPLSHPSLKSNNQGIGNEEMEGESSSEDLT